MHHVTPQLGEGVLAIGLLQGFVNIVVVHNLGVVARTVATVMADIERMLALGSRCQPVLRSGIGQEIVAGKTRIVLENITLRLGINESHHT